MTISSSLNASVAALSANATRLATISDNIANASTKGYKRVVADFQSMVVSGNGGRYAAGGVRTSTQRLIDETAGLVTTSNATDLAVSGRGMLPVMKEGDLNETSSERTLMLMTTGSFRKDENGYLKTNSGLMLLGWPAQADGSIASFARDSSENLVPIKINENQFSGDPTENIDFKINLPAKATESGKEPIAETLSINYYDNLGGEKSLSVKFTPTIPDAEGSASNTWTLEINEENNDDALGKYVLKFSDERSSGGRLTAVTKDVDSPGSAYNDESGKVTIKTASGDIAINLGRLEQAGGITQAATTLFSSTIEKDGAPVGTINDFEINNKGQVVANFKTGVSKALFQIPLVDVRNVNGVEAIDRQTYLPTPESGSFFLWDAETGPTGRIVSRVLQESATDVAGELTDLIQTQRAYSSNAKVIQTVDEMLQETSNIKR